VSNSTKTSRQLSACQLICLPADCKVYALENAQKRCCRFGAKTRHGSTTNRDCIAMLSEATLRFRCPSRHFLHIYNQFFVLPMLSQPITMQIIAGRAACVDIPLLFVYNRSFEQHLMHASHNGCLSNSQRLSHAARTLNVSHKSPTNNSPPIRDRQ
jgi:hypothetical protein